MISLHMISSWNKKFPTRNTSWHLLHASIWNGALFYFNTLFAVLDTNVVIDTREADKVTLRRILQLHFVTPRNHLRSNDQKYFHLTNESAQILETQIGLMFCLCFCDRMSATFYRLRRNFGK